MEGVVCVAKESGSWMCSCCSFFPLLFLLDIYRSEVIAGTRVSWCVHVCVCCDVHWCCRLPSF